MSTRISQSKTKSYDGKINTNFHNNKIPKEDSKFICLSIILINSVFRTGKNYYPQEFLGELKYVVKAKKVVWAYYWWHILIWFK